MKLFGFHHFALEVATCRFVSRFELHGLSWSIDRFWYITVKSLAKQRTAFVWKCHKGHVHSKGEFWLVQSNLFLPATAQVNANVYWTKRWNVYCIHAFQIPTPIL